MTYVVALIPARSGSSLDNKNIRKLAGVPLLVYSIRAAQKTRGIDRVIVSTDSPEYADIARAAKAEVPFRQPEHTARSISGDYPCIEHFLEWADANYQYPPDLILHLRPTTPLRDPQVLEIALNMLMRKPDATSMRSVHPMSESAHKQFEIEEPYLRCLNGSRWIDEANAPRQLLPKTYHPNGYVDILRPSFIRRCRCLHGDCSFAFQTERVTEVDTEEDFQYLEYQIKQRPEIAYNLFK